MFEKLLAFTVPSWVKLVLELVPYAIILSLLLGLEATRGTLQHVRDQDKIVLAQEKAAEAVKEKAWADSQAAATATYTQKLQELQPVILNSIDTGKAYASTPSGKSPCLTADRVHSILASRNTIFASTTASSTRALQSSGTKRK